VKSLLFRSTPLLFLAAAVCGCATTTLPLVPIPVPLPRIPFIGGEDINLARKHWHDAAERLVEVMQEEYPYTEHKGIDWDTLGSALVADVRSAEEANDSAAFYLALRRFVESLHDGNVILTPNKAVLAERFGGSFGMELVFMDDGRVLVHSVEKGSPARDAGVEPLDEILTWNGAPIKDAVAQAPMLWADQAPATARDQQRHRLRGLTRVPADTKADITWRSTEGGRSASITAVKSPWSAHESSGILSDVLPDAGSLLETRWLNNETGYIKVRQFAPSLSSPFPGRAFNNALTRFRNEKARHLVLDLRGNTAGLDEFAAELAGYLVKVEEEATYRELAFYDEHAKAFEVDPSSRLVLRPHEACGLSPVIVLVDEETSRAAESLTWTLQERGGKSVLVVGSGPTRGITTVPDRTVNLPDGNRLTFPIARWQAQDHIAVEADAAGEGGVTPDLPVPAVVSTLKRRIAGEDVVLDRAMDFLNPARPRQ
jgi:carboxyl-terminal processing protease